MQLERLLIGVADFIMDGIGIYSKYYEVPESWNGMPPKWQRLFFFPKEKL
jgi:hypothetical protein